ncbi:hypothetical protein COU61_01220 [Candidatus Pacearchaeota archaeon CG10_big_fil_rev_8_21_14_0_10_35_13]|nr:MAG: hypothetical protein COU61_01220 [Candidatus Pacearchaeota archaeon CG10_big_fil_rev_8_21_14_0_10_35_13]
MVHKKEIIVLSLGGSLIFNPLGINNSFLDSFRRVLLRNSKRYKFVVVCGGGSPARAYINSLKNSGRSVLLQSMIGISITRTNARFMSYFFGIDPKKGIPHDMSDVKNLLLKNDLIFCGALHYAPKQTSDSTAVKLAHYLKARFINITNVDGLYDKNPLTNKSAKFIPEVSSKELFRRANALKFHPGQHFVIDQEASRIILKYKVKSFILGDNLKNLDNLLNGKPFRGTEVLI